MPTDTASSGTTIAAAARIPVLTSGAKAMGTAQDAAVFDPVIARVSQGHFLVMDVLTILGTAGRRRPLPAGVLPPGRGQL